MYRWYNFTVIGNRIYQFSKETEGYKGITCGGNDAIITKNCIIIGNFAEIIGAEKKSNKQHSRQQLIKE